MMKENFEQIQDEKILRNALIVSVPHLKVLGWTISALSIALTVGRLAIRWRKVHHLTLDDVFNAASAILIIPFTITCFVYMPIEIQAQAFVLQLSDAAPSTESLAYSNRVELANLFLFWIIIYMVKASFLALFWRLFNISHQFRIWWWGLTIFTALSFGITTLLLLWRCGTPDKVVDKVACDTTNMNVAITLLSLWCGLHVTGGVLCLFSHLESSILTSPSLEISNAHLVMIFPIYMVNSRMLTLETPQRIGITLVFGLVLVDIAFDIVRTIYALSPSLGARTNLIAVWLLLEPNIAYLWIFAFKFFKAARKAKHMRSDGTAGLEWFLPRFAQ